MSKKKENKRQRQNKLLSSADIRRATLIIIVFYFNRLRISAAVSGNPDTREYSSTQSIQRLFVSYALVLIIFLL